GSLLSRLLGRASDAADRRKIAEALAGHPDEEPALARLVADPDAAVRAEAVWSLGAMAARLGQLPGAVKTSVRDGAVRAVLPLVSDAEPDVAANAAGASALLGASPEVRAEARAEIARALCKAAGDFRPYVRTNALSGLGLLGARCSDGAHE